MRIFKIAVTLLAFSASIATAAQDIDRSVDGGGVAHVAIVRPLHSGGNSVKALNKGQVSWASGDKNILKVFALDSRGAIVNQGFDGQVAVIHSGPTGPNKAGRILLMFVGDGKVTLNLSVQPRVDGIPADFTGENFNKNIEYNVFSGVQATPTPVVVQPTPTLPAIGVEIIRGEPI